MELNHLGEMFRIDPPYQVEFQATYSMEEAQVLPSPSHFSCNLDANFESEEKASIVYAALNVDKELQPDKVKRVMAVSDGKIVEPYSNYSVFVDVPTPATRTIEVLSLGMERWTYEMHLLRSWHLYFYDYIAQLFFHRVVLSSYFSRRLQDLRR